MRRKSSRACVPLPFCPEISDSYKPVFGTDQRDVMAGRCTGRTHISCFFRIPSLYCCNCASETPRERLHRKRHALRRRAEGRFPSRRQRGKQRQDNRCDPPGFRRPLPLHAAVRRMIRSRLAARDLKVADPPIEKAETGLCRLRLFCVSLVVLIRSRRSNRHRSGCLPAPFPPPRPSFSSRRRTASGSRRSAAPSRSGFRSQRQ